MTVMALVKVIGGLLVATGVISVEENTSLLAQVPQILALVAVLVPTAYSLWHSGEVVAGIIKKILVRMFDKERPIPAPDQGVVMLTPQD